MARTLKGNLTGKAAQTALREFRESLNERPSSLDKTHVMNICKQIHLIMGDEYGAWVEAQSNDNAEFKAAAIAKLAELETLAPQEPADEIPKNRDPRTLAQIEMDLCADDWKRQVAELRGGI